MDQFTKNLQRLITREIKETVFMSFKIQRWDYSKFTQKSHVLLPEYLSKMWFYWKKTHTLFRRSKLFLTNWNGGKNICMGSHSVQKEIFYSYAFSFRVNTRHSLWIDRYGRKNSLTRQFCAISKLRCQVKFKELKM